MAINGKYIRGFICPDFAAIAKKMGGASGGTTTGSQTIHTVKAGDTFSKIASEHKTTVDALVEINAIKNKNLIRVGNGINLDLIKGQMRCIWPLTVLRKRTGSLIYGGLWTC